MTINRIPRHAVILICDAGKALLLRNEGDVDLPDLRIENTIEAPPNPDTVKQGTDRPGRMADQVDGAHKSALEQTDWHRLAENEFVGRVAAFLADRHASAPNAPIIVAAPPRMLGELRKALPESVVKSVIAELAKDLANLPTEEFEGALLGRDRTG